MSHADDRLGASRERYQIAERYAAGETMAQLAADYEVGEATIFRALQGPFEAAA